MAINTDQILRALPCAAVQRDGAPMKRNLGTAISGFHCAGLTDAAQLRSLRTFIAFDTETTGLSFNDDVIELSAVRFVDFVPAAQFTTLICPRRPISPQASAVNHITDDMVADAPYFHEMLPSAEAFFGDAPLIAHNAPFDVKMMYVNGWTAVKTKTVYDTCALSRQLFPAMRSHKLGEACGRHQIIIGNAHRAASDAAACGLLFVQLLMQQFACSDIRELLAKAQS